MRRKLCALLDIVVTKKSKQKNPNQTKNTKTKPKSTNHQAGGIKKYVLQGKTS